MAATGTTAKVPLDQLSEFADRLGVATGVTAAADGAPLLDTADGEELAAQFAAVELAVGDDGLSAGSGTVYVTTRRIVWVPSAPTATPSLSFRFPQIVMHAVSNDTASYARPCVYLQLDEGSDDGADGPPTGVLGGGGGSSEGEEGEEEGEEEEGLSAELRLVPADANAVEAIFKAMCDCSALNPDSDMEDDGQAELFFDEAEVLAGLPADQRDAAMAARAQGMGLRDDIDALMEEDPDRFGDDEEEEEGEEEDEEESAAAVTGGGAQRHSTLNGTS